MHGSPILGAILAGGRSRRFGSDKALARAADGRTLLEHAADGLRPHVDALVICGRAGGAITGIADRPAADMGPLGGLNAALHHACVHGFAGVLTSGCDMPVYPAAAPPALIGNRACVLAGQPLIGWWPATLAAELDAHLGEDNNRSIRGWLDRIGARVATISGLDLPNINRPADLARWQDRDPAP